MKKNNPFNLKRIKLQKKQDEVEQQLSLDDEIKAVVSEEKAAKKAFNEWLKNNKEFSPDTHINNWETGAEEWSDVLLDFAIQTLSSSEGLSRANEKLAFGMGMRDVSIDEGVFSNILLRLFKIRTTFIIAQRMGFSEQELNLLMDCCIRREFGPKTPIEQKKPNPSQAVFDRLNEIYRKIPKQQISGDSAAYEQRPKAKDEEYE